jgi:hypothetical protein
MYASVTSNRYIEPYYVYMSKAQPLTPPHTHTHKGEINNIYIGIATAKTLLSHIVC